MDEYPLVTRIEVIDHHGGRAFVRYYETPGARISIQDNSRTIKVFMGANEEEGI